GGKPTRSRPWPSTSARRPERGSSRAAAIPSPSPPLFPRAYPRLFRWPRLPPLPVRQNGRAFEHLEKRGRVVLRRVVRPDPSQTGPGVGFPNPLVSQNFLKGGHGLVGMPQG